MTENEEFEFRHRLETEQEHAPQWSDIPHNIVEGIKETPETLKGMANTAMTIHGFTPSGLVGSAGEMITGTPMRDTTTGMSVKGLQAIGEGLAQGARELPGDIAEFSKHPLESTKNHIIEHPISSAVDAASVAVPFLRGTTKTAAKYAGRMGENQMGKLHGTSAQQFRQLGRENFGDVMRDSYKEGDANLLKGSIGREEAIKNRIAESGKEIGNIRGQANAAGAPMLPDEMAERIRKNLEADYKAGGKNFEHEAALEKQLNNIKAMPEGGIENFAQRARDINKQASKNKLIQPVNAETDVANQLSRINDEELATRLPGMIDKYHAAKDRFGNAKSLLPMEARGEAKDALAKSPSTMFGAIKDVAQSVIGGPKLGAQAGFKAEGLLKSVAKNAGAYSLGGVTSTLMNTLLTNPQVLGKYAKPLSDAAQKNGSQGVAATHYLLSNQDPAYNELMNGNE